MDERSNQIRAVTWLTEAHAHYIYEAKAATGAPVFFSDEYRSFLDWPNEIAQGRLYVSPPHTDLGPFWDYYDWLRETCECVSCTWCESFRLRSVVGVGHE